MGLTGAALVVLIAIAIVAFLGYVNSEHTSCFADFDTRQAADRAASAAREAGHDADVEPSGRKERRPTSEGGRRIGVTFRDGETGDDARGFRRTVTEVVRREQDGVPPFRVGNGCVERGPSD